jgi:hypothetical protein
MSTTHATTPACTLTILLLGDLAVCVDDFAHTLTAPERRMGLTGPIVSTRLGVVHHCQCAAWSDTGTCWHALELRAIVINTVRTLRDADDVPHDQQSAATKRAVAVAHLLTASPRPHLWPGMLPASLRPCNPGWGEPA